MSPRPRQASDEQILRAAFRAIARLGPARLTLKDVAEEAGISAAAVVQRFGSKRDLLLAAAKDVGGGSAYIFPGLRARHRSPLAALLGMAECMALVGTTPEAITNTQAFLQTDLDDPEFHQHALAAECGLRDGLRALVRDAIAAGELVPSPAGRLASALVAVLKGSQSSWAVHREGTMVAAIRRDLRTVLDPYRAKRTAGPARKGTRFRQGARSRAQQSGNTR